MSAVLEKFPGAQRALFRRYHIGGCSNCGFLPMDLCPHGAEVGSHGTANWPHGLNFARTNGKMAARNDLSPHGKGVVPHEPEYHAHETIFRRTDFIADLLE